MDYISPEDFSTLPPDEQEAIVKQYIMEMSVEDRKIVKKLLDEAGGRHED